MMKYKSFLTGFVAGLAVMVVFQNYVILHSLYPSIKEYTLSPDDKLSSHNSNNINNLDDDDDDDNANHVSIRQASSITDSLMEQVIVLTNSDDEAQDAHGNRNVAKTSSVHVNTIQKKGQATPQNQISNDKLPAGASNVNYTIMVDDWDQSSSAGLVSPTTPELKALLETFSAQPATSTVPWPNVTTLAYKLGWFHSGYRNQIMAFSVVVFEARRRGHGQLLINSFSQKDTYGSNKKIPFDTLWDVPYWNSHYPHLPRLVTFDATLHDQYNMEDYPPRFKLGNGIYSNNDNTFITPSPVRPYMFGNQQLMYAYKGYAKGVGDYAEDGHRNAAEILMLKGAMRPHPDMQAIIDEKVRTLCLLGDSSSNNNQTDTTPQQSSPPPPTPLPPYDYMTLHARVEPDMQAHPMCRDKKVLNLTDIFDFIQTKWKEPPVSTIFMPINRQYMEKEGQIPNNTSSEKINWIAVENLKALNWARDEGLWNGRAKVIEFGANALEGTRYAKTPSTPGAMLNFFIGVDAKIFIGTEVSSFSHDLLATRFFRNYGENYKYLPDGLHDWTPPGIVDPPGFRC